MKHEANLTLDLTDEKEAALYNTIRSIDSIKNSIIGFKTYINNLLQDANNLPETEKKYYLPKIKDIIEKFYTSFRNNGIAV